MSGISSLALVDSGRYYSTPPTVVIDFPTVDASLSFAGIESGFSKFGFSSLEHSDSLSVSTMGTLDDDYGELNQTFNMMSFWLNADSIQTSTLAWSNDLRVHLNDSGYIGITYTTDSIFADSNALQFSQTKYNTVRTITKNNWHFIKIETSLERLRIGVDSSFDSHSMGNTFGRPADRYFYDSDDIIKVGADFYNTSPMQDSYGNKSFIGNIDNFQFTSKGSKVIFDNFWSNWYQDSADEYYEYVTPLIDNHFDYKRALFTANIDSSGGVVSFNLVDSGYGYTIVPNVTFIGGSSTDSNYRVGDTVEQTFSSGVKITGEIQRIVLDSNEDSSRYYHLAHVGADDGLYHTFVSGTSLINQTLNSYSGLTVSGVEEINKISNSEQNTDFSNFSDDFLDFSEDNPFGDPEAQ
jgi:hypothetical protein